MNEKRRGRLEQVGHGLTALVVILKSIDKLTHGDHLYSGIIFLIAGLIILSAVLFHHRLEQSLRHVKGLIFSTEALVIAMVGWIYFTEGKHLIQYACWIAAMLNLAMGIYYLFFYRRK